jgi:hypothetical protein
MDAGSEVAIPVIPTPIDDDQWDPPAEHAVQHQGIPLTDGIQAEPELAETIVLVDVRARHPKYQIRFEL